MLGMIIFLILMIVAVVIINLLVLSNEFYFTQNIPDISDYVIIGGGVAGCVLARRLADKYPNKTITILERGFDRRHDQNVYRTDLVGKIVYNLPYSEALKTNYEGIMASAARMYGGGSSHNYGMVVEGSSEYYTNYTTINIDKYRERIYNKMSTVTVTDKIQFNPSISFVSQHNVIPFIKEGLDVFFSINSLGMKPKDVDLITKAFQLETEGAPVVDNYNGYLQAIGKYQILFNDRTNGVRGSVNRQYLPDKYYHPNLIRVENAEVHHIGEPTIHLKDGRTIEVREKIIVSAGAISTPRIIQRSPDINHPNVGKGLRNHYGFQIVLAMKDVSSFISGPVIYTTDKNHTRREFQCIVANLINYPLLDKYKIDYKSYQDRGYTLFSFTMFLLNPSGYGEITQDNINLSMFTPEDNTKLNQAYEWLTRVYKQLDAVKLFPGDQKSDIPPWRDSIIISDHYSCNMKDVVDNYKLITSKMTYIVDASVMEEISDGNTEFPTIVIAECAAEKL